jgi:hypothetical protein
VKTWREVLTRRPDVKTWRGSPIPEDLTGKTWRGRVALQGHVSLLNNRASAPARGYLRALATFHRAYRGLQFKQ